MFIGVLLACRGPAPLEPAVAAQPSAGGPVVLITVEGLRADAVAGLGGSGWTANLDALIGDAAWAGRAIAPSSWVVPSLATVFTGLRPWQHQAISPFQSRLGSELTTLAEALSALGYEAHGFHDNSGITEARGYEQGFQSLSGMRHGSRAVATLASSPGGKKLYWLHLYQPLPPYVQRAWVAERLGRSPTLQPRRLEWADLEPYVDPDRPLPPRLMESARELYRFNVMATDLAIGRLLEGLRKSGQYDASTIAVVSLYGQEFGEQGRLLFGESVGRPVIEVPLILKLPRGATRSITLPRSEPVALARLWATLVEAAGGEAPPGVAPSLFTSVPYPLLSELYSVGGRNELSLVEGELQLRWTSRFTGEDRAYYDLRAASARDPKGAPKQELRALVRRLYRGFRETPPLAGTVPVELRLERWTATGTTLVEDEALARQMADRLRLAWERFNGDERSAADVARERSATAQ